MGRPSGSSPSCSTIGLFRRRNVQTGADRESLRPESVTNVLGINCHLCVRKGPTIARIHRTPNSSLPRERLRSPTNGFTETSPSTSERHQRTTAECVDVGRVCMLQLAKARTSPTIGIVSSRARPFSKGNCFCAPRVPLLRRSERANSRHTARGGHGFACEIVDKRWVQVCMGVDSSREHQSTSRLNDPRASSGF
jgi:hypothetical protein